MLLLFMTWILSFIITFLITPRFIRFFKSVGIVAFDLHKRNRPILPSCGGVPVAFGFIFALMFFIAVQVFIFEAKELNLLLASCSSALLITFVGLLDDMNVKRELKETKRGELDIRVGLKQWLKPLMTLPAAIPLMAVKAGTTMMSLPLFGTIDFGILYPLLLIPIGVVGASNVVNMLGGFNGSEAGMGFIYTTFLGIFAFMHGNIAASVLLLSCSGALLAFLFYNFYPAKILPGDSLTYLLGAVVATSVVIGNMERAGIITMTPFIVEFFLKLRSRFKATCLGKLGKDGKLKAPYGRKIYSLTHIIMNLGKFTEKQVTIILMFIQLIFSIIPFILYL